jgi:hypothetical protein
MIKIKIRNQNNKDENWNINNKKNQHVFFLVVERRKRKKILTVDKSSHHCWYGPHREEVDATTYPATWCKGILSCWEAQNTPLKGHKYLLYTRMCITMPTTL